jgi:hypothetical protein
LVDWGPQAVISNIKAIKMVVLTRVSLMGMCSSPGFGLLAPTKSL